MTTIENRQLIAAELAAAARAYRTAIGRSDAEAETRAGDRWHRALLVATALLSADYEHPDHDAHGYYAGERVAWVHVAALTEGEPLPMLAGTVRERAYPVGEHERPDERIYVVGIDTECGTETAQLIYSGDLVLLPPELARVYGAGDDR